MGDFPTDISFAEAPPFIEEVKRHLGPKLITISSWKQDVEQATDLIVMRAEGYTIGVRLRRRVHGYYIRYPDQFTIRYQRDNGTVTELAKIISGWGELLFYGHAEMGPWGRAIIEPWLVIDLRVLRHVLRSWPDLAHGRIPGVCGVINSHDGTRFLWIDRKALPPACTFAVSNGAPACDPSAMTRWLDSPAARQGVLL